MLTATCAARKLASFSKCFDITLQSDTFNFKSALCGLSKKLYCFSAIFCPFDMSLGCNAAISKSVSAPSVSQGGWTYCTELFEGYPAVSILVCVDDGLINDLLQLRVLQVIPHHHLQHLEELTIGDVAVLIHIIDPKGNWRVGTAGGGKRSRCECKLFTLLERCCIFQLCCIFEVNQSNLTPETI